MADTKPAPKSDVTPPKTKDAPAPEAVDKTIPLGGGSEVDALDPDED